MAAQVTFNNDLLRASKTLSKLVTKEGRELPVHAFREWATGFDIWGRANGIGEITSTTKEIVGGFSAAGAFKSVTGEDPENEDHEELEFLRACLKAVAGTSTGKAIGLRSKEDIDQWTEAKVTKNIEALQKGLDGLRAVLFNATIPQGAVQSAYPDIVNIDSETSMLSTH